MPIGRQTGMMVELRNRLLAASATLIAVAASCAGPPSLVADESEVSQVLVEFGSRLQLVSVQSPDAVREMMAQYSGLASPSLLEQWVADPLEAPGRTVSSPWPDRIEVNSITQLSETAYSVTGNIVLLTSSEVVGGGAAGLVPIRANIERIEDRWLITVFEQ